MKKKAFVWNLLQQILVFIGTCLVLILCCLYFQCEMYQFSATGSFSGNHYYNPYQNDTNIHWSKANFHAHAIAWNHITNGYQQPQEIFDTYKTLGYDIACISNYHNIPTGLYSDGLMQVPVYEHGYNTSKTHQMVFEPSNINFFDPPFFQNIHTKQSVLQSLRKQSSCIALNHPAKRNGYTHEDLRQLSGYDLMEVFNHSVQSTSHWDAALSAGKAVWCLGNDDMHNLEKRSEVGVCWTMIGSVRSDDDIVPRLKSGNHYIVKGAGAINQNYLKTVRMKGDTLRLTLVKPANVIRFIGQEGRMLASSNQKGEEQYVFNSKDTYVRVEVETDGQLMYLNPVIRYDGLQPPSNANTAQVDLPLTVMFRFLILVITASLLMLLHRKGILGLLKGRRLGSFKPKARWTMGTK